MAVLAHRPGTRKKICVRCMWPEDSFNPQPRVEPLRQPQNIKTVAPPRGRKNKHADHPTLWP
jgi:hypothetical protein